MEEVIEDTYEDDYVIGSLKAALDHGWRSILLLPLTIIKLFALACWVLVKRACFVGFISLVFLGIGALFSEAYYTKGASQANMHHWEIAYGVLFVLTWLMMAHYYWTEDLYAVRKAEYEEERQRQRAVTLAEYKEKVPGYLNCNSWEEVHEKQQKIVDYQKLMNRYR